MHILDTNKKISSPNITSLCIGHFDGLHLGHKKVFNTLDKNGAILSIGIENSILTPYSFRDNLTKQKIFGLYLHQIKHLNAKEFLLLIKEFFPNFKKLIVGYDFKMGKNRECDLECLRREFKNIEIIIVDEYCLNGVSVHSGMIKEMISKGDIKQANIFLAREYFISGNIISGQGLGSKNFVPTINISNNNKFLLPSDGVYATSVNIDNKELLSISFIGHRASTDNNFAVETHIINNDINLSHLKILGIKFYYKLRDNIYFQDKKLLKKQILKDIKKVVGYNTKL